MAEPSRLILFEQLPNIGQGSKVRFLACVNAYDQQTATLIVQDHQSASGAHSARPAFVNIENILENVSREVLEVGAWINVLGTVSGQEEAASTTKSGRSKSKRAKNTPCAVLTATMIWSAGAIKLEEYRAAVEAYQQPLELR